VPADPVVERVGVGDVSEWQMTNPVRNDARWRVVRTVRIAVDPDLVFESVDAAGAYHAEMQRAHPDQRFDIADVNMPLDTL
jgi:hypothetical protein